MVAMDRALAARLRKDRRAEHVELLRAVALEAEAAALVPLDLEPTRSVLYRSAASIAVQGGDLIRAQRLAIDGLRGNVPSELRSELIEILTNFAPEARPRDESTIFQQLRIRRVSKKGGALGMQILADIQAAFFKLLDAWVGWKVQPAFQDAGVGSFVVRFAFDGSPKERSEFQRALEHLQDAAGFLGATRRLDVGSTEQRVRELRMRGLLELLTSLSSAKVRLEVTTEIGKDVTSFELVPPKAGELKQWQHAAAGRISSGDVPQADDLTRVMRFVELLADGEYPTPASLDVVGRQVNYYRRAAEILNLVRDRRLTASGRILVRLAEEDRWTHLLENVTTSEVGSAWIDWAEKTNFLEIDRTSADEFLKDRSYGLSPNTLQRRGSTLAGWHEKLSEKLSD